MDNDKLAQTVKNAVSLKMEEDKRRDPGGHLEN
jgi:hypothetical protein